MAYYDERLQELQKQVSRKAHLDAALIQLREQQEELKRKTAELKRIKIKEEADVERLEGGILSAFFYGVIGKMDEKLTKERRLMPLP